MNAIAKVTMSSVELVSVINELRAEGKAELRHDNFMAKIEKHPGIDSPKFSGQYKDSTGRSVKCYHLPKRECELMVMSESLEVQTKVYDRMTALEQALVAPKKKVIVERISTKMREAALISKYNLQALKLMCVAPEMAQVINAKMVREYTGIDYTPHLAGYVSVEDVPMTPTQLGQLMDGMSPKATNDWLVARSLQVRDAKGNFILTELGKQYGVMEPFQSASSKHVGYRIKWYRKVASVEETSMTTDELGDMLGV